LFGVAYTSGRYFACVRKGDERWKRCLVRALQARVRLGATRGATRGGAGVYLSQMRLPKLGNGLRRHRESQFAAHILMMPLLDFLRQLQTSGIVIGVEADKLLVTAPKGALTPELRQQLSARKQELLEFLRSTNRVGLATRMPAHGGRVSRLSRAQRRLWFLDQMDPGKSIYNMAVGLRIRGKLNHRALALAFHELLRQHPALTTVFPSDEAHAVAVRANSEGWQLEHTPLEKNGSSDLELAMLTKGQEHAQRPFDLATGPLIRGTLIEGSATEWLLVITLHHILADGWSLGIIGRDLNRFYQAFASGGRPEWAASQFQYEDFVKWEAEWLAGEEAAQQLAYWKERLSGQLPILKLPIERVRPPVQTSQGKRLRNYIPRATMEAVEAFSQRQAVTPFMVCLAAFQTLLYRYTGAEDVIVGTPTAGRSREEFGAIVGLFVNNLVLRADLTGNPRFSDFLVQVRRNAVAAYAHGGIPFDQLVEALRPPRDLAHSPLFQVYFAFQNLPLSDLGLGGLETEFVDLDLGISRFDFTVEILTKAFEYRCYIEYNTQLFDEASIRRLFEHYVVLLSAVAADPDCRVGELPWLTQKERQEILVDWNQTRAPEPEYAGVHEWFQAQARGTPDRVAVRMGHQSLSYGELDTASTRLADYLRGMGVKAETVVGVYLERSPSMLVALMGILKAGGAYLPLDPSFPRERLGFMVADTGLGHLVTQRSLIDSIPGQIRNQVLIDEPWPGAVPVEEAPKAGGSDLAYVIYTSGSTGKPKGIEIPHRALLNLLGAMRREPGLGPEDVLLAVTTLSFDIAALELFLPLVTGAQVVLASKSAAGDPEDLARLLSEEGVTVMQATPSTWRMLLDSGWEGNPKLKVLCGGEALPVDLASALRPRCQSLWNMYGPTETTVWSAVHQVEAGEAPVLVGRPIANTRMYVLDAYRQPVPEGVVGELYIAGTGVARGYVNRLDLTAERFLPEPFSGEPGARMYRTGDLARYHARGQIEILSRVDDQVKIRGYRIELGEIEQVLGQHPSVRQAVVKAAQGEGGVRLLAYVLTADQTAFNPAELRQWAQSKLPEYMVPSMIQSLPEFPKTPNGKIDRKALPEPGLARPVLANPYVAPRSPLEQKLESVWAKLLNVAKPGLRDNFFELGGHSVLILHLLHQLRQTVTPDLSVIDLFQHPTIERQAAFIDTKLEQTKGSRSGN